MMSALGFDGRNPFGNSGRGLESFTGRNTEARVNIRSAAKAALSCVGVDDFLQTDRRPTFVVDLSELPQDASESYDTLQPVYCNPSLVEYSRLFDEVHGKFKTSKSGPSLWRAYSDFKEWVVGEKQGAVGTSFMYKGFLWSSSTVQHRWRIISGTSLNNLYKRDAMLPCRRPSLALESSEDEHVVLSRRKDLRGGTASVLREPLTSIDPLTLREQGSLNEKKNRIYDWTGKEPPANMTAHIKYARSIDWKNDSPLGPMKNWSPELRSAANVVMSDIHAAVMFWGPEKVMIYNEKYIAVIEAYHPCFGKSVYTALQEYIDQILPVFTMMDQNGEAVYQEDVPLFIFRRGQIEEAYFSLKWLPLLDSTGRITGYYESIHDTTSRLLLDRKLSTFLDFGAHTSSAQSLSDLWPLALDALGRNEKDVPFCLLYAIEDETHPSSISCAHSHMSSKTAVLKGHIGVPSQYHAAQARLSLESSNDGFAPYFREALKSRKLTMLHVKDGTLPEHLIHGLKSKSFGDNIRSVVVSPITPTCGDQVLGFLVLGCNPRRPFDDGSASFIAATSRMLATSMASVVLLEEEVGRRQAIIEEASQVQADLSEKLIIKERMMEAQEQKFHRFAERADLGIFITDAQGKHKFRNNRWYEIFATPKDNASDDISWRTKVESKDLKYCEEAWTKLCEQKVAVSFSLRLNQTWKDAAKYKERSVHCTEEHKVWILASIYPELAEDGTITEIVGCVTDISHLKWAERIQQQRMEDALEAKRQLETFIDTTSHEMRNPLSAITHCADGLLATAQQILTTYPTINDIPRERRDLMETIVDSAQTIIQCATHQKRIVDDVLVMSKLESGFLIVTPVDVQPKVDLYHALKMFEGEAKEANVQIEELVVDQSYRDLEIDWVLYDPTRVAQVFIKCVLYKWQVQNGC
jgi:PAS domain-containing protein